MITTLETNIPRYSKFSDNVYYNGPWVNIRKNKGISKSDMRDRERNHLRQAAKDKRMGIMERFNYENTRYLIDQIRRYRKNNVIYDEYEGEPFPVYMSEYNEQYLEPTQTCKGCNRHYKCSLNFVNHNICNNCYNLPLPSYPNINSMPCIVEKYFEYVDDVDKGEKVKVYIKKNSKTSQPINNKLLNENNLTKKDLKHFEPEYIKNVIEQRIKLNLNQDQFARRINYNANMIKDFEAGRLLYNNDLRNKINDYLKI